MIWEIFLRSLFNPFSNLREIARAIKMAQGTKKVRQILLHLFFFLYSLSLYLFILIHFLGPWLSKGYTGPLASYLNGLVFDGRFKLPHAITFGVSYTRAYYLGNLTSYFLSIFLLCSSGLIYFPWLLRQIFKSHSFLGQNKWYKRLILLMIGLASGLIFLVVGITTTKNLGYQFQILRLSKTSSYEIREATLTRRESYKVHMSDEGGSGYDKTNYRLVLDDFDTWELVNDNHLPTSFFKLKEGDKVYLLLAKNPKTGQEIPVDLETSLVQIKETRSHLLND
ncbi:hypothetical protein HMPREF9176_1117 [Streptococcus downei F0415]|uniref:hypothetical protein n=1 Tax=Streptococcus downei TaxID=1317 RepID=UPI0001E9ADCC|nr:hypothetical protein [Streptococcus downei]EFQ56588.1 hypothetical protein HMPREF9176_1117 [Streptococcus downei F0415]